MTDQLREIKRQPKTNIQGMAAVNSVSAQSLVMRNQIVANAKDAVHVAICKMSFPKKQN